MDKRRFARIGALATTAVATAALIGGVVATTGAYFTDSHGGGVVKATEGNVALKVNGSTGNAPTINFSGLLPGASVTSSVTVQNTGTGNEDIYLVFDNTNGGWSAVNALGAYGAFTIDGTIYDNLNNRYPWGTDSSGQFINTKDPASGCYMVPRPAQIKFLPHYIKVAAGLTTTASKTFDITFALNPCMTSPNIDGAGAFDSGYSTLNFSVVAFQAGVDPTSSYNGANKIAPLTLPYGSPNPVINGWDGTYQDR